MASSISVKPISSANLSTNLSPIPSLQSHNPKLGFNLPHPLSFKNIKISTAHQDFSTRRRSSKLSPTKAFFFNCGKQNTESSKPGKYGQ